MAARFQRRNLSFLGLKFGFTLRPPGLGASVAILFLIYQIFDPAVQIVPFGFSLGDQIGVGLAPPFFRNVEVGEVAKNGSFKRLVFKALGVGADHPRTRRAGSFASGIVATQDSRPLPLGMF